MNKKVSLLLALTLGVFIAAGCKQKQGTVTENKTSPIAGEITVMVDESVASLMQQEAYVYTSQYPDTKINLVQKPEGDAVNDLLSDKVQLIVIPRKLEEIELAHFKQKGYTPQQVKIAYDGLAFIVNNNNPDTALSEAQLTAILKGEIKTWGELNHTSAKQDIQIVFDNNRSGAVDYIARKILQNKPMPANSYAMKSANEVINYVAANPNVIGIIGVNLISNKEDSTAQALLKTFKIVGISTSSNPGEYLKPFRKQIAWQQYPFKREIYMIKSETYTGLGTGFASFVASDRGQTIVKREGLVPASNTIRMIEIKNSF